jgi:hypothetical protein
VSGRKEIVGEKEKVTHFDYKGLCKEKDLFNTSKKGESSSSEENPFIPLGTNKVHIQEGCFQLKAQEIRN